MPQYAQLPKEIATVVDNFLRDPIRLRNVDKKFVSFFKDGMQEEYMKLAEEERRGQPEDVLRKLLHLYRVEMHTRDAEDTGVTAIMDMIQIMEQWLPNREGAESDKTAHK